MFDVTIYTDVRPSESLDGQGGFNFQSASQGVRAADQRFITESMLHVVSSSWHVDHDELAHPPTCIYRASDDRFLISRGKSIGMTVTAPRPGNQLTETILTGQADDFVPYRPAQLYGALRWSLSKAPGKQIESWPTPLEIDPLYEADALKADLVDNSPYGMSFLPAFLTMIELATSGQGGKLIIVHTDLDVVMRYIALGSLFLDTERALAMSFNAFAQRPLSAVADIVGATPEFGVTPDVDSGGPAYNVIDLLAGNMTNIEVSPSAARQAQWFTDGDPIDALTAIDLARRWESVLGADVATAAAGIVSFSDGVAGGPQHRAAALLAVAGLASTGFSDDLAMYADELLDAIMTSAPSTDADIHLAADAIGEAHQAGLGDIATAILLPTMEALAAKAGLVSEWASATSRWADQSEPLIWESDESRQHGVRAQTEIVNNASTETLVDVLVAGRRTGLLPREDGIDLALGRLADHWCRNPELAGRRAEIPYQPVLGGRLTRGLVAALEDNADWAVSDFSSGAWDWLGGPDSPLSGWRSVVKLSSLPLDLRIQEIAADGAHLPTAGWRFALSGAELPGGAPVVEAWMVSHPILPAGLSAWILTELKKSKLRPADAWAARRVVQRMLNVSVTTSDQNLTRLLTNVADLLRIFSDARRIVQSDRNAALTEFAATLGPYSSLLLPECGYLLVKSGDSRGLSRLERACGKWAHAAIDEALAAIARQEGDVDAVEWALSLCESGSDLQCTSARAYLVALTDSRDGRGRLAAARADIAPSWVPFLDELLDDAKKGRLTRNLVRGGKRLFNKER